MRRIGWFAVFAWLVASAAGAQVTYSNRPPPLPPDYYPGQTPPGNYPGQPPAYYPNQPGYPGYNGQTVSCGSPQYRLARCRVPSNWRGARIVRQLSSSACVEGRTWGFDQAGIWVNKGCSGVFGPAAYGGGWQPGSGWNTNFQMSCGSPQYRYYFCQVDVGARGRVVLQRQTSDTRCVEGRNWGWNRAGIWVDKGCGGEFLVVRRW